MCSISISRMMYFFLTFPNPSKRQSTTSCTDVYGGIEHPLNSPMGFGGVISVPSLEYDPLVLEVSAMMFCNVDHFTSLREFGLILNMNSKARSNRAAVYLCVTKCGGRWRESEWVREGKTYSANPSRYSVALDETGLPWGSVVFVILLLLRCFLRVASLWFLDLPPMWEHESRRPLSKEWKMAMYVESWMNLDSVFCFSFFQSFFSYLCSSVCVCEKERKREREYVVPE